MKIEINILIRREALEHTALVLLMTGDLSKLEGLIAYRFKHLPPSEKSPELWLWDGIEIQPCDGAELGVSGRGVVGIMALVLDMVVKVQKRMQRGTSHASYQS